MYKEIIGTSCDSIQIMIALCYASLMSHFPGYTFYMLVKRIKDLKGIPKKMEDIFEIARNLMQEVNENQIKNLEESLALKNSFSNKYAMFSATASPPN